MKTDYREYALSPRETRKWLIISAPSLAIVGYLFYHSLIIAGIFSLLAIPLKKYYKENLCNSRRDALAGQFKDLLASLASSFQAGRQMTEALKEAADNLSLIYDEKAPIMKEIRDMNQRLICGRESESAVLFDFADRSSCDDIVGFTDVYFTCLTTGADQVKAVARASELIMEKIEMRSELKMLTAQKKLEAKILAALPLLILGFLTVSSPDYLDPLYRTPAGLIIMTASLIAMAAAFRWSTMITDIKF